MVVYNSVDVAVTHSFNVNFVGVYSCLVRLFLFDYFGLFCYCLFGLVA